MRQFADHAGISNPYLSQIERGPREPSQRVLDAIASTLHVTAHTLNQQAGVTAAKQPKTGALEQAIRKDPRLTGRQRHALLDVYRAFNAQARPRRARGDDRTEPPRRPRVVSSCGSCFRVRILAPVASCPPVPYALSRRGDS